MTKRVILKSCCCLLAVLSGVCPLWGQEPAGKEVQVLEEVVVTATKTPRNPADVPASITIITAPEMARQHIKTVDDALRQVPGTYVDRSKMVVDSMANVNLRGFPADTQKRTLVLLDGQDMSTGYATSVSWNSLAVEDVERIEVIRGPFSALYGGNAMGGVINIITKTPKKLEAQANFAYGTYDTGMFYLSAGNRFLNCLSLKGSYNFQKSAGYPSNLVTQTASAYTARTRPRIWVNGWEQTSTTTGGPTYIIGDNGDYAWGTESINTKLSWDIAPGHKLNVGVLLNWSRYDYTGFHTYLYNAYSGTPVVSGNVGLAGLAAPSRFSSLQEGTFLNGWSWDHTAIYSLDSQHRITDRTTLKFRAGLTNNPLNTYNTPSSSSAYTTKNWGPGTITSTPGKSWNLESQVDQAVGSKQVFTAGFVYKGGWASTKEYNLLNWRELDSKTTLNRQSGGRERTFALYLQDEITWHPMVTTVLGGRLDWWRSYGGSYEDLSTAKTVPLTHLPPQERTAFSPKAAVLFRPWEWMSWRASWGTAFRPPNVYELYRTRRTISGVLYLANPYLKPETTMSWEVGLTVKPFAGNVITTTFFHNFVDDMIYRVLDTSDPTGKTQVWQNAGKVRINGWELEVTQKLSSWLDVFGNMTLVDARLLDNPYDTFWTTIGKKLTSTPRQLFNFGTNLHYWVLNGNLSGRYVSKLHARADNYDTVNNVPGSYDPFFTLDGKVTVTPVKYVNLSLAVDNILNRQYFSYYVTPGRTWWLQVGLKY